MLKISLPAEIESKFDHYSLYLNYNENGIMYVCADGSSQNENGQYWVGAAQVQVDSEMRPQGQWEWVAGPYDAPMQ
jgi:hypothetical protein